MSASDCAMRTTLTLVPEPQHAFLRAVDGALRKPFERGLEEQQVVLLPHRVVRRTGEIHEDLLRRTEIGVELAHALLRDLLVMNARDHEHRCLRFRHNGLRPAPRRRLWRAADACAPGCANR